MKAESGGSSLHQASVVSIVQSEEESDAQQRPGCCAEGAEIQSPDKRGERRAVGQHRSSSPSNIKAIIFLTATTAAKQQFFAKVIGLDERR